MHLHLPIGSDGLPATLFHSCLQAAAAAAAAATALPPVPPGPGEHKMSKTERKKTLKKNKLEAERQKFLAEQAQDNMSVRPPAPLLSLLFSSLSHMICVVLNPMGCAVLAAQEPRGEAGAGGEGEAQARA